MYTVYVLKSLKNGKRYVGYSSKDAATRLKEHNQESNKWTKQNKPLELVRTEGFETKAEAIKREKFLKSGVGRTYLNNVLTRSCSSVG